MSGGDGSAAKSKVARKQTYFTKLLQLLEDYPRILIVSADNVGSNQMQKIRIALRGTGVVLMGKNTMIRKAMRGQAQNNPALEALIPYVYGNIGFVFTKGDLSQVKKIIIDNKVAAPAKVGATSPIKVVVPAGNTGLEPTQTSFFQALNIPSKIAKGQIEIVNDVILLEPGQKVGASESNLLAKLNIKPFSYGLVPITVYDNGAIYEPDVLDLSNDDIIERFRRGIKNVAAVSLAINQPTTASVPYSIARGFKNVLAVSLETGYAIPFTEKLKNAAASAPAPAAKGGAKEEKKEEKKETKKKEEPKEEVEDEDMGFGLFD